MTRRRFGLAALAAAAALVVMVLPVVSFAGTSDQPPSGIRGRVFQPPAAPGGTPTPVEDAMVRLIRNGQVVAQMQTDEQGRYAFPNVQPGHYRVGAFKPGVGHDVRRTIVFPGQIVIVPLLLQN